LSWLDKRQFPGRNCLKKCIVLKNHNTIQWVIPPCCLRGQLLIFEQSHVGKQLCEKCIACASEPHPSRRRLWRLLRMRRRHVAANLMVRSAERVSNHEKAVLRQPQHERPSRTMATAFPPCRLMLGFGKPPSIEAQRKFERPLSPRGERQCEGRLDAIQTGQTLVIFPFQTEGTSVGRQCG